MTELESTMGKAPGLTPNFKRKKKERKKTEKDQFGCRITANQNQSRKL